MRIISMILLCFLVTSCASVNKFIEDSHNRWVAANCNPIGANNAGLNDGLTPHKMPNSNFADNCPSNQSALNASYLEGFKDGLKGRPQEVTINNVNVTKKAR